MDDKKKRERIILSMLLILATITTVQRLSLCRIA